MHNASAAVLEIPRTDIIPPIPQLLTEQTLNKLLSSFGQKFAQIRIERGFPEWNDLTEKASTTYRCSDQLIANIELGHNSPSVTLGILTKLAKTLSCELRTGPDHLLRLFHDHSTLTQLLHMGIRPELIRTYTTTATA